MSEAITIHQLYISSGHGFDGRFNKGRLNSGVQRVDPVERVAGRGLLSDRYFDFEEEHKRPSSLITAKAIEAVETEWETRN